MFPDIYSYMYVHLCKRVHTYIYAYIYIYTSVRKFDIGKAEGISVSAKK